MSEMRFTRSDVGARPWRRGFTFTEVLFAVMLLGIGFVMVAAIFPVAIQQSQANREDTAGIIVAKAGAKMMESIPFSRDELTRFRADTKRYGVVWSFDDQNNHPNNGNYNPSQPPYHTLFSKIQGNLISQADPRYAWVPLGYKVAAPIQTASGPRPPSYDVYIVAVACRNKSTYSEEEAFEGFTFVPKRVAFTLTDMDPEPDQIKFATLADAEPAAEGAFIVVADDQDQGVANGRMYRLGSKVDDFTWELLPGWDMTRLPGPDGDLYTNDDYVEDIPLSSTGRKAIGYIIGRGYSDPLNENSPLEGPAQDLFAMRISIPLPLE